MDESPYRCTVPRTVSGRIKYGGVALLTLVVGVAAFPIPFAGPFLSLVCFSFGLLFLLAALAPKLFLLGAAVAEDGFELRRPLRMPKFVPFASIGRIEAFCRGDGEFGDEVHFVIHSRAGKVFVQEEVLHRSRLRGVLAALPGFDGDTLAKAARYEPSGLDLVFGKRFTVYENPAA